MRIVRLQAENVKRLRAVEITPDGDVVVVSGRNAQGKSSVLDAIWLALAGAAGAKETTRPIRDGETHASVSLDLGDLVVVREWTEKGTTLKVTAPDGARYSSPQSMLDELIGRLSFDPLAFANESPKEQLATLLSVVELPFDLEQQAVRREGLYNQRTDTNREVKRLAAIVGGMADAPDGLPDEEIDQAALAAELEEALRIEGRHELAHRDVTSKTALVAALKRQLLEAETDLANAQDHASSLPPLVDSEAIRVRLDAAETVNRQVRARDERAELAALLVRGRQESQRLTDEIAKIEREKADAIAAATMPLEGLSFDEDGVLFQGVPFSQSSSSERLRVGIAMAMALNPKIRVIRITDGSLLDSENLALIAGLCAEHDFQCWVERVDESGEIGVVIEDGQIAAKPTAVAAA
jgi:hypothetical protein